MTLRAAAEQFTSLAAVRNSPNCGCVTSADPDDTDLGLLIDQASDALAIVSNMRVYGRSTKTVYPCRTKGTVECACGCHLDRVPLPGLDPVVTEVREDGVVLDPATYELHQDRLGWGLVRVSTDTTRPDPWPSSQSMWLDNTNDDTFSITYTQGAHIDWVVEQAAIELVCDFAAWDNGNREALPAGARSANMGGVVVTLEERVERLRAGNLGPAVERFMGLYAPDGRQQSEVWAPELEAWTLTEKR